MRSLKLFFAILIVAVIAGGAAVAFTLIEGGRDDATKWEWARGLFLKERTPSELGDVAADADLRLEVTAFDCTPKGVSERCVATVFVQRTSQDELVLNEKFQYLHLDDVSVAAAEVGPSPVVPLQRSRREIVWNDVPRGGALSLELHEGLLSGGVLVDLKSK